VELVDAPDSKSGSARSDGSSPSRGTILKHILPVCRGSMRHSIVHRSVFQYDLSSYIKTHFSGWRLFGEFCEKWLVCFNMVACKCNEFVIDKHTGIKFWSPQRIRGCVQCVFLWLYQLLVGHIWDWPCGISRLGISDTINTMAQRLLQQSSVVAVCTTDFQVRFLVLLDIPYWNTLKLVGSEPWFSALL
jgi:hypothetical protein